MVDVEVLVYVEVLVDVLVDISVEVNVAGLDMVVVVHKPGSSPTEGTTGMKPWPYG